MIPRLPPTAVASALLAMLPFALLAALGDRLLFGNNYLLHALIAPLVSIGVCAIASLTWAYVAGCATALIAVFLYLLYPNLGGRYGNPWAGLFVLLCFSAGSAGALTTGLIAHFRGRVAWQQNPVQAFCLGFFAYIGFAVGATMLVLAYKT